MGIDMRCSLEVQLKGTNPSWHCYWHGTAPRDRRLFQRIADIYDDEKTSPDYYEPLDTFRFLPHDVSALTEYLKEYSFSETYITWKQMLDLANSEKWGSKPNPIKFDEWYTFLDYLTDREVRFSPDIEVIDPKSGLPVLPASDSTSKIIDIRLICWFDF